MNYKVEKTTADVYKIRLANRFSWAMITIRRWKEGGSIDVQSDFGSFSNSWGAIGPRDFREFLIGLNYDYFMEKAAPGHTGYRFSLEKSIKMLRERICDARRDGSLNRDQARRCWDAAEDIRDGFATEKEDWYYAAVLDHLDLDVLISGDVELIPTGREREPGCREFWKQIWPVACEVWRAELAQERAAA